MRLSEGSQSYGMRHVFKPSTKDKSNAMLEIRKLGERQSVKTKLSRL